MPISFTRYIAALAGIIPLTGQEPTPVVPHASHGATDWVLSSLNDPEAKSPRLDYTFPETSHKVRLYLIDTAVDNTAGWFDTNNILDFGGSQLIRGAGDPTSSSAYAHGTQVLSVIAGPEGGVSRGTEIEVVSFDIYPDGEETSSTVGLLITALGEVINHYIENPGTPSVICIANGSSVPATSSFLEARISEAVGRGMTVVVAAGNDSTDASAFIPAAYGSMDGVICVGASDQNQSPLAISNSGDVVDIHAPGDSVQTFHPENHAAGQSVPMTGTSPATAIVAATVLAELGRQPDLNPAQVENLLKARAYAPDPESKLCIVQLDNDFDGDGTPDELERLFGYDPLDPSSNPPAIEVQKTDGFATLHFTINAELLNANEPKSLVDGSSWRLLCSTDLENWMEVDGYTHIGSSTEGQTSVVVIDASPNEPTLEGPEASPLVAEGAYELAGFDETGIPLFEKSTPDTVGALTLVRPPGSRARCFYKLEWIPARLNAE